MGSFAGALLVILRARIVRASEWSFWIFILRALLCIGSWMSLRISLMIFSGWEIAGGGGML